MTTFLFRGIAPLYPIIPPRPIIRFLILSVMLLAMSAASPMCKKTAEIPGLLLDPASDRPRVSNSSPRPGESGIDPESPIYLEFDRKMNKRSVQDSFSFSGTGPASGEFQWVDNRMYYRLDEPLEVGQSYELTLRKNASDAKGETIGLPYYLSFHVGSTVDAPVVESSTPSPNASDATPGTSIEVTFSRPMTTSSVESAFSILPSIEGTTAWSDSNTRFTFMPYDPLEVGRTYQVSITTEASDLEGITLNKRYSSNFQVGDDFQAPEVENVFASGNPVSLLEGRTGILKNSKFTVEFSEAMHYQETPDSVTLRERNGSPAVDARLTWNENFSELEIDPSEPLKPETEYRLRVGTGARDQAGNPLPEPFTLDFTVDSSAGINSGFLSLEMIQKVFPLEDTNIQWGESHISTLELPAPYDGGWSAVFELEFSHSIERASVLPENVTIAKVAGAFPGTVYIKSIQFLEDQKRISLEIRGLRPNLYRLTITGRRDGLHSTPTEADSSTWMESDQVIYFRPEEE
ncbi:MAG: hypothetical protein CMF59_15870 [Leptospiraceae bacterium]|nr:hypothetical protein [Leptospiraceae bacterium]